MFNVSALSLCLPVKTDENAPLTRLPRSLCGVPVLYLPKPESLSVCCLWCVCQSLWGWGFCCGVMANAKTPCR